MCWQSPPINPIPEPSRTLLRFSDWLLVLPNNVWSVLPGHSPERQLTRNETLKDGLFQGSSPRVLLLKPTKQRSYSKNQPGSLDPGHLNLQTLKEITLKKQEDMEQLTTFAVCAASSVESPQAVCPASQPHARVRCARWRCMREWWRWKPFTALHSYIPSFTIKDD